MRILVTGATGMLGANLVLHWSGAHDVVAAARRPARLPAEATGVFLDVLDAASVAEAISGTEPDLVVHCAAATDVDRCERQPAWAEAVNVEGSRRVAEAAEAAGARLVHISTDAVYGGGTAPYPEGGPTVTVNTYARSKLAAEAAVTEAAPGAVIVRTAPFGLSGRSRPSLADWVLARLESGGDVPGFADALFSPVFADDLGDAALLAVTRGASGPLNIGSAERASKYDFARAVARAFGYDEGVVRPVLLGDSDLSAERPRDVSLDCSAAARIGIVAPVMDEGVERMACAARAGRLEQLRRLTCEE